MLQRLLGGHEAEGRLIEEQTLQPRASRVFRLNFVINGQTRQLIVKRLKPEIGRRSELVEKRWLPAVGMSDNGPALLGSVVEPRGNSAWHVYDDLGPCGLDVHRFDHESVGAATKFIARLHTQFARNLALSADPDQQFLYVGNGQEIAVVDRKAFEIAGSIKVPGQIGGGHHIATDSKGNIYIAQTGNGFQKLTFKGMPSTR